MKYKNLEIILVDDGSPDDHPIDPEITDALMRAADILASAGAEVIWDVPMPKTKYSVPAYFVISRIEAYSNLQQEEKAVVDSFHGDGAEGSGKKAYTEVLQHSAYYLADPTHTIPALAG